MAVNPCLWKQRMSIECTWKTSKMGDPCFVYLPALCYLFLNLGKIDVAIFVKLLIKLAYRLKYAAHL